MHLQFRGPTKEYLQMVLYEWEEVVGILDEYYKGESYSKFVIYIPSQGQRYLLSIPTKNIEFLNGQDVKDMIGTTINILRTERAIDRFIIKQGGEANGIHARM